VRGNPIAIKDFQGLFNPGEQGVLDPAGNIPDNAFIQAYNVMFTNSKTIRVRKGIQAVNNSDYRSLRILGIYNGLLVFSHNAGVRTVNPSTYTEATIDGANPAALMLEYNDVAYLFYPTAGNIRTWNGAVLTATALNYQASIGVNFKSRFFVVPNEATGVSSSQVRYTDIFAVNAPNTASGWTNGGTIDVSSDDGDFITGLVVLNDTLIIFKRQSTWALYVSGSPSTWTLRNLHPQIGCIGGRTAKVIGGLIYFRATSGLYRTDGTTFEKLSGNVDGNFKEAGASVAAATCNLRSACWWQNYYLLQNGNPSGLIDVYNIETGAWSAWLCTDYDLQDPFWYEIGNTSSLFFVDYDSAAATGRVVQYQDNVDSYFDGNNQNSVYGVELETKWFDFDQPTEFKLVREIDIDASIEWQFSSSIVRFNVVLSNDNGFLDIRTDSLTSVYTSTLRNLFRFRGPMRTRTLKLNITHDVVNDLEINSLIFDVGTVGRVGSAR